MGSKVVSTKLSEEEYGKLVGLSSASGDTVSKLLKRAILSSMNEENAQEERPAQNRVAKEAPKVIQKPKMTQTVGSDNRFLYY